MIMIVTLNIQTLYVKKAEIAKTMRPQRHYKHKYSFNVLKLTL